jgi:hypothetical protein
VTKGSLPQTKALESFALGNYETLGQFYGRNYFSQISAKNGDSLENRVMVIFFTNGWTLIKNRRSNFYGQNMSQIITLCTCVVPVLKSI